MAVTPLIANGIRGESSLFYFISHCDLYAKNLICLDCNRPFLDYIDLKYHNRTHDFENFSTVFKKMQEVFSFE